MPRSTSPMFVMLALALAAALAGMTAGIGPRPTVLSGALHRAAANA